MGAAMSDEIVRCKEGKLHRVIYAARDYLLVKPHGERSSKSHKLKLKSVVERNVETKR